MDDVCCAATRAISFRLSACLPACPPAYMLCCSFFLFRDLVLHAWMDGCVNAHTHCECQRAHCHTHRAAFLTDRPATEGAVSALAGCCVLTCCVVLCPTAFFSCVCTAFRVCVCASGFIGVSVCVVSECCDYVAVQLRGARGVRRIHIERAPCPLNTDSTQADRQTDSRNAIHTCTHGSAFWLLPALPCVAMWCVVCCVVL